MSREPAIEARPDFVPGKSRSRILVKFLQAAVDLVTLFVRKKSFCGRVHSAVCLGRKGSWPCSPQDLYRHRFLIRLGEGIEPFEKFSSCL